jgi:hypothetical protein
MEENPMRIRVLFLLALTLGVGVGGLRAQAREREENVLLGRVIDATTGTPLVGAFVHLDGEDWGVLTGEEGAFRLTGTPTGILSVVVEQLGYVKGVHTARVEEGAAPILLALEPDPVLLEGIQVVTDRFERRRRSLAIPSQAFDREDLVTSPAFTVLDFVAARTLLQPVRCGTLSFDGICAYVRGSLRPVSVYVDEAPMLGGLDYLDMIEPYELQRVEVYRNGTHIRLYTQAFMERAGKIRLTPLAALW